MVNVIAYYPGAGGNRYLRSMYNLEYKELRKAYDFEIGNIPITSKGLYLSRLDTGVVVPTHGNVLTHCVNYSRLEEFYPCASFTFIKVDLMSALRREWSIKGKLRPQTEQTADLYERFVLEIYEKIADPLWPRISSLAELNTLNTQILDEVNFSIQQNFKYIDPESVYNFVNAAYTAIIWHTRLYSEFPLDPGNHTLVDIETSQCEFSRVMREEINEYKNNELFNFAYDVFNEFGSDAPISDLFNEKFGT